MQYFNECEIFCSTTSENMNIGATNILSNSRVLRPKSNINHRDSGIIGSTNSSQSQTSMLLDQELTLQYATARSGGYV